MASEFIEWLLLGFGLMFVKTLFIGAVLAHAWRGFDKIGGSQRMPLRTLFGGLCAAFLIGRFFWLPDTFNLVWLALAALFAFCAWHSTE